MTAEVLLLFLLMLTIVAVAILVAYVWIKDPYKTALGSLLATLAVLVGTLKVPEMKGPTDLYLNLGIGTFKATGVIVSTGTPPLLWATALVSIVILVALFAVLIFLRDHARVLPAKALSSGGDGGPSGRAY